MGFHEDKVYLNLHLEHQDNVYHPHFSLDGNILERGELVFLSDSFVNVGRDVYEVHSVGNNYRLIPAFEDGIMDDMLDKYLSVFYSYIENVEVTVENFEISLSSREVEPVPTLVFEKVDVDKTLYMRVADSVDGMHSDFIDQFNVNQLAHRVSEGEFEIIQAQPTNPVERVCRHYTPKRLPNDT